MDVDRSVDLNELICTRCEEHFRWCKLKGRLSVIISPLWAAAGLNADVLGQEVCLLMNRSNKGSSFSICAVVGMTRIIYLVVWLSSIVSCSINEKPAGIKADLLFKPP
jgi:hypothetical protein